LQGVRGIEVGHLFKLGTAYSNALDAFYLDNQGLQKACVMGCYGLGVSRVLASAIEQNHDSRGIIWPLSIAPYQVQLLGIGLDKPDVIKETENLYDQLTSAGLDVLYDDRPESPGVKFNDADLLGIPVRLVVSPRTLENNSVEIKNRVESEAAYISLDGALAEILDRLKSLEL
jgi:prolyl-tRNA synthetase